MSPKWLLTCGLTLSFLLHILFINEPPKSQHLWRQSNTLAVARNFYQEEMNIFHTRVDNRYTTNGITGSQFPSYEFILAGIYHITGEKYYVQRLYALLWHFVGCIGIYYLFSFLFSNKTKGAIAAWAYLWCPVLFYYAITALPDNLALPASVWGIYCTLVATRMLVFDPTYAKRAYLNLVLGAFLLILGGATKIQYLSIGAIVLGYLIHHRRQVTIKVWAILVFFGATVCLTSVAWYVYAIALIKKTGLTDFGLVTSEVSSISEIFEIGFQTLISALPESIMSYPTTVLILVGIFVVFKYRSIYLKSEWALGFLIYTAALLVFVYFNLERIKVHDYYLTPLIPCLLGLAMLGFGYLTKYQSFIYVIIIAQPIFCSIRMIPSRFMGRKDICKEFYDQTLRKQLVNAVPNDALCIVGPDGSGCIYFYELEKKGFCYSDSCQLVDKTNGKVYIESYIEKGYKHLYSNDSMLTHHKNMKDFLKFRCKVGSFWVYDLKRKQ